MSKKSSKTQVYSIKITLKRSSPPIWRRVYIASDSTLADLHDIIQRAMGWHGGHLHAFEINGRGSTYSDMMYDDFDMHGQNEGEEKVRLSEVAQTQSKFTYEYDFGDGWEHEIKIEGEVPFDEVKMPLPYCVKGKRACPPEDCGGVWGYADMLEKLASPDNEEREDAIEWLGEDFDPEDFDINRINKRLEMLG